MPEPSPPADEDQPADSQDRPRGEALDKPERILADEPECDNRPFAGDAPVAKLIAHASGLRDELAPDEHFPERLRVENRARNRPREKHPDRQWHAPPPAAAMCERPAPPDDFGGEWDVEHRYERRRA